MRMMVDLGSSRGGSFSIIDTPTSVDCGRDVRFRRSFRSLVECMVPCCSTSGFQSSDDSNFATYSTTYHSTLHHAPITTTTTTSSTVTGTFFGYRKGRVSFCLQDDTRNSSSPPLLLLEFSVPTAYLAREMQYGLLRIALECDTRQKDQRYYCNSSCSLFNVPVWSMYCNGRKVGYAVRRQQMTASDARVLKMMQSVSVGAGVLPNINIKSDSSNGDGDVGGGGGDLLMYLRARFQRVFGSAHSESFHMINPVGSSGQELSIFMLRSS